MVILCHLERLADYLLIITRSTTVLRLLDRCNCGSMIKLHVSLRVVNVDRARLHGHEVRAKHHLPETIVVHVLEAGLFLCAVDVDSDVLLVNLVLNFTSYMLCSQMNVVEYSLLSCVF